MDAFGTRAAPARSSFPSSSLHATSTLKSIFKRRESSKSKQWKPPALHPFTLAIAIATPLALIVTLVLLLRRSQRDNGILFAPDINALPLSRTFMFQYFPTILAVVFSIFWAWIDLETKRLEPYYRLSEENAGIFSTEQVTRNVSNNFDVSTSSMPLKQQTDSISLKYAQSAYGIVSLNETLPSFMARNYTLAPFRPTALDKQDAESLETGYWTAPTTLYSLDLYCEPAMPFNNQGIMGWNNSGCAVIGLEMGNHTIGEKLVAGVNPLYQAFSAQYIGFWNKWGFADFDLSQTCPAAKNHTFFAAVSRNKEKDADPAQNITAIFCEPTYYAQEVNATVDRAKKQPVRVVPLGPKQPLKETNNIFNTTLMEMLLNGGIPPDPPRENELPGRKVPNFIEQVMEKGLTWPSDRQPMVGFSTMVDDTPLEDFLDWKVLAQTYAKAYRLVFARAMAEVLISNSSFTSTQEVAGSRSIATGSVVLEPLFTYIVIGLLGVIAVVTMVLLLLSTTRTLNLRSDPTTIGTLKDFIVQVMGLVADSKALLRDFEDLDCCTLEQIQQSVQQKRYQLVSQDDQLNLIERRPATATKKQRTPRTKSSLRTVSTKAIDKPTRPIEFSSRMSMLFISGFIALAALLATVFIKARKNGLPLPSPNKFVQNLLENYIPTAIATLIEPLWVLINRLLCLLQPIEELQTCNAKAKDSIDIDYSSLPPQLVVFKALRARHFVLAAVCSMALLANVLSIAFAGLFHHDMVVVLKSTSFEQPHDLRFVSINGSIGPIAIRSSGTDGSPSGAYRGGDGRDQFYILGSNLSRATPLPPWTDEKMFYLPFKGDGDGNAASQDQFESETVTLGARLNCEVVDLRDIGFNAPSKSGAVLNKTVRMDRSQADCSSNKDAIVVMGPGNNDQVCQNGTSALELVLTLEATGANATQEEKEVCMGTVILGWIRNPEGSCKSPDLTAETAKDSLFIQCQPKLVSGE
ncbi:uncharacterized protein N0V89_010788 [Didymosphaeria variabile]|uniref:Uncharacterized protein n=1 Tax=Didymosphaeria variabile TaxID=1932322 RepID=A0A9W8XBX4_9PLEO|nr:uncharacterized protein N0V89_010788 [Didymosphaeria variabile]KAJ4346856.1 hypothetical protein N0V89_010788 [Didymosphaeria variabile]